jgi:hypothetical protein
MIEPIFHDGKKNYVGDKKLRDWTKWFVAIHNVFEKNLVKLNSNQLNIKKIKSTKIILEKTLQKKNTKETGKKPYEEKLYQFIVFCEEKLVFTCNCNS